MNTRANSDKAEIEKAYREAIKPTIHKSHEPLHASTPFVPREPITPSTSYVPEPTDTPVIKRILSDSPLSLSSFGLTAPQSKTVSPPSPNQEQYSLLPEDKFGAEPTRYISFNQSAVTESAIESSDKDTEAAEAQSATSANDNVEPIAINMNDNVASPNISTATLKYAVEAVPFFDGQNIPIEYFVEGCELAKSMVPADTEPYLTKIIQTRLTGEARRAVQEQNFFQIHQLISYLKNIFGLAKSLPQLQAELGQAYQKAGEQVLAYANRVKTIGRDILEAHRSSNNGIIDKTYKTVLENEINHCFIRGLTPEIEQRINRDLNVSATVNEALKIERELRTINEIRGIQSSQNIIALCQICQKPGHTTERCRLHTRITATSRTDNEILICQICKKRGHSADKCHFREPTRSRPVKFVQSNTVTCQNCNKTGHVARDCQQSKNLVRAICQICEKPGHTSKECRTNQPNAIICQNCNKPGHGAKNCYLNRNNNSNSSEICQWCERRGHQASQCRERQARTLGNNNTICQICNRPGHRARECNGTRSTTFTNHMIQNMPNQCRYCKATGHLIENCVLRLENNRKRQENYAGSPTMGADRGTSSQGRPVLRAQAEEAPTEFLQSVQ